MHRTHRTARRARRGFTLIETALTTVIVGVGVLAMVTAQTTFLDQNVWSSQVAQAERLANEMREMTIRLPRHDPVTGQAEWGPEPNETGFADFDDLDDFDGTGGGVEFSAALGNGPIDAQRRIIPNMAGWAQIVEVYNVDPTDIATEPGSIADGGSDTMVVTVRVTYQGPNDQNPRDMTTVSWVASR